ncbi:hypothetical protein AHAS_Ahas14G0078400 [Arachis hypogaea]
MAEVGERKKLSHGPLSCFFCGHGITKEEPVQSAVSDEDGITTRSSRTSTAAAVDHNLLGKIADAFKELAEVVAAASNNAEEAVEVAAFARACSFVAPLFGLVGFHFKFIEMDYVTKVNDLMEASKSFKTLESMVDEDVKTNTVRKQGSHSRNLLKIKRGLDFLRLLFHQILLTEGNSVRDAVSKAYTEIFHLHHGWALRKAVSSRLHHIPTKQQLFRKLNQDGKIFRKSANASLCDEIFHLHHGWALRKAVSSRLHHIPTKQQLFRKLNQDESSGRVLMQAYVTASPALLQYIDNIFLSRELEYNSILEQCAKKISREMDSRFSLSLSADNPSCNRVLPAKSQLVMPAALQPFKHRICD